MKKLSKRAIKWMVVIFGVIAIIVAGVVLAITYWPASISGISNTVVSQSKILDSQDYQDVKDFISQKRDDFVSLSKASHIREIDSFSLMIQSVQEVSLVLSFSMEGCVTGGVSRTQVKNINNCSERVFSKLKEMASFIDKNYDEKLGRDASVTIWESVRLYYSDILAEYTEMFKEIENIYNSHELKGVYGNDMMRLSISACKSYSESLQMLFFGNEALKDSSQGLKSATSFSNFVSKVLLADDMIVKFYIRDDLKASVDKIKVLEEKTDNKVNFTYLIMNDFDCSALNLSESNQVYVDEAVAFLKGEL